MTLLASTVLAWAAVHLFVAGYNAVLHVRLRSGSEHLAFGVASLGHALYNFGVAQVLEAPDAAAASTGQHLQALGIPIALTGFMHMLDELLDHGVTRLLHASRWIAGIAMALNVAGLFFDPGHPIDWHDGSTWLGFAPQPQGEHLPMYTAFEVSFIVTLGYAAAAILRDGWDRPDLRIILFISAPTVLAWAAEVAMRRLAMPCPPIMAHVSVINSAGISYVLLGRFVETADELAQRTEQLSQRHEDLRHVEEELVRNEQLAAVGELSAVIANEVQHPLAALKEAVQGLKQGELTETDRNNLLGILDEEGDRLNRLVRDLLNYARPVEPQYQLVDLQKLLERALTLGKTSHGHPERVEIDWDVDPNTPPLHGDPTLLERGLVNVVENAMQAMPSGGVLTVRAAPAELDSRPGVVLSFHDTGEGMDTLVRSKARDPFFTTRPTGTGLGLAIVERAASAHGGELELQSKQNHGTTVTLTLPSERRNSLPPDASNPP